jgi:Caspase domain
MARRALIFGVDNYENVSGLKCCVKDACAMNDVLSRHENGDPNYDCLLFTSNGPDKITRAFLREQMTSLFANFTGDVLFYFAGHGSPSDTGAFMCTSDASSHDLGIGMDELLTLANKSPAAEILLILDCCFSGALGNPAGLQGDIENKALLREGVTILAASRPTEPSAEFNGHGVFTSLVLNGLHGGAADVLGNVSAASVYALAEQALGAWDQRPLYKSHASKLSPIRKCDAAVQPSLLRQLVNYFPDATQTYSLDPTYEEHSGSAVQDRVAIFKIFKQYQSARLLRTIDKANDEDALYWACMRSTGVRLTGLGRFYWRLAKDNRI